MNEEIYNKIVAKKEFSQLPREDVKKALEKFEKRKNLNEYQLVKLTRDFLRKLYSSFSSRKLLSFKEKELEWYLSKHKSTKERGEFYGEIYSKIFVGARGKVSVIDLGAGINGLSHSFFGGKVKNYVAVEAVGQLNELVNEYFKKNKINGKAHHFSLFELEKVKELIAGQEKPRVLFLFKVLDGLEMVERDYSKKLISEIAPLADRIVVSFATKSLGSRKQFKVKRFWFENFILKNYKMLDEFEVGGEKYFIFGKNL